MPHKEEPHPQPLAKNQQQFVHRDMNECNKGGVRLHCAGVSLHCGAQGAVAEVPHDAGGAITPYLLSLPKSLSGSLQVCAWTCSVGAQFLCQFSAC